MITLGYVLGGIPAIRSNFEKVVLLIIFVSLVPVFLQFMQQRKANA
jgi:membrane-associated protein